MFTTSYNLVPGTQLRVLQKHFLCARAIKAPEGAGGGEELEVGDVSDGKVILPRSLFVFVCLVDQNETKAV